VAGKPARDGSAPGMVLARFAGLCLFGLALSAVSLAVLIRWGTGPALAVWAAGCWYGNKVWQKIVTDCVGIAVKRETI
jgi:hypothetical protein